MKTETRTRGRRFRRRHLAWAAALGVLLLAPAEMMAQKDKAPSRTSSGSSARSSSGSSARSSSGSSARSTPSRSSSSASRSSGKSSRSTSSLSRAASSARGKSSAKAPARSTSSSRPRPLPTIDPSVKPRRRVRTQDDPGPEWVPRKKPGDNPSHRPGSDYGYRHYRPYYPYSYPYYPYYSYRHYGFYGYPYYFYGPYGYFYHPFAYGYGPGYRRGPRYGDAMGGLDLNVKPKKAEVFVDGTPVGPVDRYDGFPGYLWLEPGSYELAFYLEGYETLTRRYSIYPGVVVDVKERLAPGAAVPPEPPELDELSWDERAPSAPPVAGAPPAPGDEPGGGEEVGRLQLSIRPGDTAVYLDGQFLGTGDELSQLSAGLVVEPGEHVLELVRPGYATEQVPIKVPAGERIDVDLTLRQR